MVQLNKYVFLAGKVKGDVGDSDIPENTSEKDEL